MMATDSQLPRLLANLAARAWKFVECFPRPSASGRGVLANNAVSRLSSSSSHRNPKLELSSIGNVSKIGQHFSPTIESSSSQLGQRLGASFCSSSEESQVWRNINSLLSSVGNKQELRSSFSSRSGLAVIPFWERDFSPRMRGLGGPRAPQIMVGGAQQVRTIMVEVKGNDLDRAIRKWRRKCKEENLKILKDREYFKKPSEKRVLALKERDSRIARRAFKVKLNWIMSRRQRGF